MNVILLSGGSGKRLWPLSNDVRSKQLIKLFKNNDEYESMVQRVYRQITTVDADAKITIATSKSQASFRLCVFDYDSGHRLFFIWELYSIINPKTIQNKSDSKKAVKQCIWKL